jgi:peptide/nickel transport system substrate-binding protein
MLLALGKIVTPLCFVMPARIAATDPFKQIDEYVGSGPMRFLKSEWVPGAKAVFEKFPAYAPREEPVSWLAGGKRIVSDRIEWVTMPDPATASAALQTGEVDWWEQALHDLTTMLRKNRNVVVDIADPVGNVGILCMNHLHPPFNDVRARRAILMAISQEDYMHAYVGDDDALWKPMRGFFTPGTPLYNEEGGEIVKGPRNFDAAKRLLAQSGYAGEPVTCMAAQDQSLPLQGLGRSDGRPPATPRHEGRSCGDRLGYPGRPPDAEIAPRQGRLVDVPHRPERSGLRRPDQQVPSCQRRIVAEWMGEQSASRI